MRNLLVVLAVLTCAWSCVAPHASEDLRPARAALEASGPLSAVPFEQVEIRDEFWRPRIERNREVTLDVCLQKCSETGRLANFARCGALEDGPHEGLLFNDSDVYKVIEGAAYTLVTTRDPALEARLDGLIDAIAAAQQPDGYLNTYYTMVEPAKRWQNIAHGHELYCAGHLIEAAVAYAHATGKRKLLDVAVRFADHIDATFGPGKKLDPPGHPELELALVKLWRATGEARYLALAQFFVDQRGNPTGRERFGEYAQDHKPIREQREIVGHAVRAMYLYCAVADIAGITGDEALWSALRAIWHDVIGTKMYVTGGIGSSASNEGITRPFDLPNDSAYCETCAAIGMALWNQRMFLATGEAAYADVVERELYNGFLSGVSQSGERFFYSNPLGSRGGRARVPWFDCSCCPTNVVRFLPAIGERIYAQRGDQAFIAQYVGSAVTLELDSGSVRLAQETRYPWADEVLVHVDPQRALEFELRLRIPEWCAGRFDVAVAGVVDQPGTTRIVDGFLAIRRTWRAGDTLLVKLDMAPRRVAPDPRVAANEGRVAVARGPLVYCAEGYDNGGRARNFVLPADEPLHLAAGDEGSEALVHVVARAQRISSRKFERVELAEDEPLDLVPYFTWANRDAGEMQLWLAEDARAAEVHGTFAQQSGDVWLSASQAFPPEGLGAVLDGVLPRSSGDHEIPRHTFWDHRGTHEWLQCEFRVPRELDTLSVYWFDDTGRGACRVPKSWRVQWRDEHGEWIDVRLRPGSSYGVECDRAQQVEFEALRTDALRIEVELREGFSAGVLEWTLGPRP